MIDVLIVEDDQSRRQQVADHLLSLGFTVRTADMMVRAMAAIMERKPDVVLLDLSLSDSTGVDTVAVLHRFCKELAIVAFTDSNDLTLAVECAKSGAIDFISKAGRASFLEDLAIRVRLAQVSGARLGEAADPHDSIQKRLDALIAKLPSKGKL